MSLDYVTQLNTSEYITFPKSCIYILKKTLFIVQ